MTQDDRMQGYRPPRVTIDDLVAVTLEKLRPTKAAAPHDFKTWWRTLYQGNPSRVSTVTQKPRIRVKAGRQEIAG